MRVASGAVGWWVMAGTRTGALVHAQRRLLGLSLRELGRLARVDHAWLQRVEDGSRLPGAGAAKRIARALRIDEDLACFSWLRDLRDVHAAKWKAAK
jgi:transcriptional regulator with XRE-family HTH domain